MGDRGNIYVADAGVYLYTHWDGSNLPIVVKRTLQREERWDDPPYLARILFQELIGDDKEATGYGISDMIGDNEHPIVELADGEVSFGGDFKKSFDEYIATSDEVLIKQFEMEKDPDYGF